MEFDDLQNLPGAGTNAGEGSSVEPAHPAGAFSPNPVNELVADLLVDRVRREGARRARRLDRGSFLGISPCPGQVLQVVELHGSPARNIGVSGRIPEEGDRRTRA